MISRAQNSKSLVAMTHRMATVVEVSCRQFRHSSSWQELFFSIFLLCKFLLLNFFLGFHLLNPKQSHECFQNRAPCWTKQREQVSRDVIHLSLLEYSNRSWATTNHSARSIEISVYTLAYRVWIVVVNKPFFLSTGFVIRTDIQT